MNIAIVGGGGVGGYLAARLGTKAQIDLITSSLKTLRIKENGSVQNYNPSILTTPPKEKIYDLIIFATKSFVLEEKARQLLPNSDEHTLILPLLNGIEPYQTLTTIFSPSQVLKGAIYIIANRTAPDTITLKGKGAMVVMENCGKRCHEIAKLFELAGIKVKITKDIDRAIWQKYLFIAATAALTTLHDKTFGEIVKDHLDEFEALVDEIVTIAQKKGIALTPEDRKRALDLLQKSPPHAKTSMQLDFEKGGPSEVENLIGYLAKESSLFQTIYTKLKERE